MDENEWLTIGVFARRVGLTPSALRFYDDCGVLRPAHVDRDEVRLVATDRYRLAIRHLRPSRVRPALADGQQQRILVADSDMVAAGSWATSQTTVTMEVSADGTRLQGDDQEMILPTVEGDFPDYRVLLDNLSPVRHRVITDRGALRASLGDGATITLEAGTGRLVVGTTTLPAIHTGPAVRIAFDPVVLCQKGMQADAEGRVDEAQQLFEQAWRIASDDYEACVAAHYLARHQADPQQRLRWNEECLRRADLVGDERVAGFYPSLHLNLAHAHSDLGRPEMALEHFRLAAHHLDRVPPGPYANWMRLAVADGLRRSDPNFVRPADADLTALINRLRERDDLRPLALLLPAHEGDLGTEEDRTRLIATLRMLKASRWLCDEDDRAVGHILVNLS